MKSANMPSGKITAQEYFEYCKKNRGAGRFRLGDKKGMKLMRLHIAVDQERRAAIGALGEACKKGRSEFYRFKSELQQKVDSLENPDARAVGQRVLDDASQAVIMDAKYLQRKNAMRKAGLA